MRDDIDDVESKIFVINKRINNKDEYDSNNIEEWGNDLKKLDDKLQYLKSDNRKKHFAAERQFIEDIFIDFTKPLNKEYEFINKEFQLYSISVNRPNKKEFELNFNFSDTRNIMFDTLPMGYS